MQNISPSSFELAGVAAEGEGEAGSTDATREDAGDDGMLEALICFFNFEAGALWTDTGVALGERVVSFSLMDSACDSFGFLFGVDMLFGLAVPFFVNAAGNGFTESGAGRFLPMTGGGGAIGSIDSAVASCVATSGSSGLILGSVDSGGGDGADKGGNS